MRRIIIGILLILEIIITPSSAETLKVTVYNFNDYDLTDYQIRIDLNGYLSIPSLLRVTDENGNNLKFCYEYTSGECGIDPSPVIWVKVPKIKAKSNTIIYIKKDVRDHAVMPDYVFDFYDDFNGVKLDANK